MANIIVGIIIFGLLGCIVFKTFRAKHTAGGYCHSSCKTCPFACDKED